jgi:anhydro-N-acetylmuramic acid kinase
MSKTALHALIHLKKKLVVGLISGTSADGIDAALVEVRESGVKTRFHQLAFLTQPYPEGLKKLLFAQSDPATSGVDTIARCDFLLGELFADAALRVAKKAGVKSGDIDLIGSHGQTIHHLPLPVRLHGKRIRATSQIGNISVIAKRTGAVTVGDFRSGDIAAGGTGAPLVPLFDYLALRSASSHRASLNIGGIANITVLPRACSLDEVYAFDTGPGNMIIDGLMRSLFRREFDAGGETAAQGKILPRLLGPMIRHSYFRNPVPKSTGRELFGEKYVRGILAHFGKNDRYDLIATATEFTALSIYQQYLKFIRPRTPVAELIVSGGGIHNVTLMASLSRYFTPIRVSTSASHGIDPDAKEAVCFALLANETISGNPSNVKGATGAKRSTVLGTIAIP